MEKGFSIILCTFNGRSRLRETLVHLVSLRKPKGYKLEIILVDNNSTDGTSGFVEQTWEELGTPFTMRVIQELRIGKGYAVETGYDAAQYSYLLTVDDDNWLQSDYLIVADCLFEAHSEVSILQGISEAVFESEPPMWVTDARIAKQLVIGGPFEKTGLFPCNHFFLWGAGLVFRREDWLTLRRYGLTFLTSKMAGKAAGEDSELGLGLALLGRKSYYSTSLRFKHFMPTGRLTWEKMLQNFEVMGYVGYFMLLYAFSIEDWQKQKEIDVASLRYRLWKHWLVSGRMFTMKQHLAYQLMPRQEYYQLMLAEYYARLKWIWKLSATIEHDVETIRKWVRPLVEANTTGFKWP